MAKVIPLKTLGGETSPKVIYLDMIKLAVSSPDDPKVGLTVEEIRRSVKVLDILDVVGKAKEVVFEDAEYEYLKRKVLGHKYPIAVKDLVTYFDDIENAVSPKELEKENKKSKLDK